MTQKDDAMMGDVFGRRLDRRTVLRAAAIAGTAVAAPWATARARSRLWLPGVVQATLPGEPLEELTIDLPSEPPSLDPAIVYDVDGWSVVHSVYDALVQYGPDGRLEPLLAQALTLLDPLTYEVKLRQGVRFHNGEAFDAHSVAFSVAHLVDPATGSQLAETFRVIERVEEVDPFTVRLRLARPAPWLPAQMAAWLAMLPPAYAADPANDFGARPVGTGPYRFVEWERGSRIVLEANGADARGYFGGGIKGAPMARQVAFRFVPDAGTRVADLLAGTVGLIRGVPVDQTEAVRAGNAEVVAQPVAGAAWVRIPTDVAPFDDVRVRQALNYAVDVDAIVQALLGGIGVRLPNVFVPGGLGFDPDLAPYPYDPDRARALLADAGHRDGFATTLAHTDAERQEIVAAVAGMLEGVGVRVELQPVETATFNATWTDPNVAPLRFATWRPLFDPHTLLDLVVSDRGFLSRHGNPNAQPLIDAGASETDEARRAEIYRQLGRVLRDEPAAIYLYGLTALYGVAAGLPWTPLPDDYIIPTVRG